MIFSKRLKLEKEYFEWIKGTQIKDCPFNVISFLDIKGYLINKPKHENDIHTW
jgi:hypothetical protein